MTDRQTYKRDYWKQYKKSHKRVYGTLTPHEFRTVKNRADQNGRAMWTQIWMESCAYRKQQFVPSNQIEAELTQLKVQLRKIGNNINQIAHQSNVFRKLTQQRQLLNQLKLLEEKIETTVQTLNSKE